MPKYRAKLDDGRTVLLEADEQPSEDDVLSAIGGSTQGTETSPSDDLRAMDVKPSPTIDFGLAPPPSPAALPIKPFVESPIPSLPTVKEVPATLPERIAAPLIAQGPSESGIIPTGQVFTGKTRLAEDPEVAAGREAVNSLLGIPQFFDD